MNQKTRDATYIASAIPEWLIRLASRNQFRSSALRRVSSWGASFLRERDGVIPRGAGNGLRFNAGGSHSGFLLGTHKPGVQKLLANALRSGMTFYDVGANVGFYSVIAARLVGAKGNVVCFEPVPDNARRLEQNARMNGFSQVVVRGEALGGTDRTESFLTSSEPTWGRLATSGVPDKHTGEMVVSVRRLDSIRTECQLPAPDMIKIDVEGAEVEVITGAIKTISETRPALIIELHGTNQCVADVLDKLDYHAVVMGTPDTVERAHWNATVVAAPQEKRHADWLRI
jgi:FkbM family methyltransferase